MCHKEVTVIIILVIICSTLIDLVKIYHSNNIQEMNGHNQFTDKFFNNISQSIKEEKLLEKEAMVQEIIYILMKEKNKVIDGHLLHELRFRIKHDENGDLKVSKWIVDQYNPVKENFNFKNYILNLELHILEEWLQEIKFYCE